MTSLSSSFTYNPVDSTITFTNIPTSTLNQIKASGIPVNIVNTTTGVSLAEISLGSIPTTTNTGSSITVLTSPSPVILLSPCEVLFINSSSLGYSNINNLSLMNNFNQVVSSGTPTAGNGNYDLIFSNVVIPYGGNNQLSLFDKGSNKVLYTFEIETSGVCFAENTKILTNKGYLPIQKIKAGTPVKIYLRNGGFDYREVKHVIKNTLSNSKKHSIQNIYKLSKSKNPQLIEDLYVTGSHALFHDSITEDQYDKMNKLYKHYNKCEIVKTDASGKEVERYKSKMGVKYMDKFKLIPYYDDNFEEVNEDCLCNIYHIVLENNSIFDYYAIYANGILCESTPELTMLRVPSYSVISSLEEKRNPVLKLSLTHSDEDNYFVFDNKQHLMSLSNKRQNKRKRIATL